jgi:hypothetical protein
LDITKSPRPSLSEWAEWLLEFPPTLGFVRWSRRFPRWGDTLDLQDEQKQRRSPLPGFIAFLIIVYVLLALPWTFYLRFR